jgi:hypothetical protein
MTRRLLIEQLARARAIGDLAAITMLLARIRKEAATTGRVEPITESEQRLLDGNR